MTYRTWHIAWIALLIMGHGGTEAGAAPCLASGDACARWISLSSAARTLVYSTHDFRGRAEEVTRALIIVHGGDRAAEAFFRIGIAAALSADTLNSTMVIAPRFASRGQPCNDRLSPDEVSWDCGSGGAGGWRSGERATSHPGLSSFDAADAILNALNDPKRFPKLGAIVVAGFSAGGQFVQRYAAANRVHDGLRVQTRYVAISPSSYLYLDARRPNVDTLCLEQDLWPYGVERLSGYAASVGRDRLQAQFLARRVTYMVGALDGANAPSLDTSCAAAVQGTSRLDRAETFVKSVSTAQAKHDIVIVPQCGHHAACMLIGREPRAALFGP